MLRGRPSGFGVAFGVGAILFALGTSAVSAQPGTRPSDLRPAIDDSDDAKQRRRTAPRARTDTANPTDLPTFERPITLGNPPAYGAGTTGFDSTNKQKRPARPAAKGRTPAAATPALAAPLSIAPQGAPTLPAIPGSAPIVPGTVATPSRTATTSTTGTTSTTATTTGTPATTGSVAPPPAPGTAPRASALLRVPVSRAADSETATVNTTGLSPTAATIMRRRTAVEEDAFAPIGIRHGTMLFLPSVETTGGYDTNPARTPDGRGSWFAVVAPELLVRSDWVRHELIASLRGSYSTYTDTPELDRPAFDGKVTSRVDVTRDFRLNLEGLFVIGTDNPGSPNVQAGLERFPIFFTYGGSAGFAQRFNRIDVSVKGTVERTEYQDSVFTDGNTESNRDRDFHRYGALMRVSYDLLPGLKPFVEAGGDTRVHDLEMDRTGLQRDSTGWSAKAGSSFEFSRLLTGEFAVGYLQRFYKDPTLPELNGVLLDGSLIYWMNALTNIKLTANTSAQETIVPGVAGVFTRNAGIEVEHAFRRWLVGSLKFNYGLDDYVGSERKDDRFALSGSILYKMNRIAYAKAEVRREWLRSTLPGNDYDAMVYLLGVKLMR